MGAIVVSYEELLALAQRVEAAADGVGALTPAQLLGRSRDAVAQGMLAAACDEVAAPSQDGCRRLAGELRRQAGELRRAATTYRSADR